MGPALGGGVDLGAEGGGGADSGDDFELAAKETPVELTTWPQGGGTGFVEEGAADLVEGGAHSGVGVDLGVVVGGGADLRDLNLRHASFDTSCDNPGTYRNP